MPWGLASHGCLLWTKSLIYVLPLSSSWALPQYKDDLSRYRIPIMKIRRSWDRLIFIIGIHILVKRHHYIETAPDFCNIVLIKKYGLHERDCPEIKTRPGGRFSIKTTHMYHQDPHDIDKTVSRLCYLYQGNRCTRKDSLHIETLPRLHPNNRIMAKQTSVPQPPQPIQRNSQWSCGLTYWDQEKMAHILQTTIANAFSCTKIFE